MSAAKKASPALEKMQAMQKVLGKQNVHQVPRLRKIVVNVGMGRYMAGSKDTQPITEALQKITGQKPAVRAARKSISNFRLREGMPVGAVVTLRGSRMDDFLSRLIHVVFPRLRDFRGFSKKGFDGRGGYSLGISEHLIFPEIPTDDVVKPFGMQITLDFSGGSDADSRAALEHLGFPFQKPNS